MKPSTRVIRGTAVVLEREAVFNRQLADYCARTDDFQGEREAQQEAQELVQVAARLRQHADSLEKEVVSVSS